jgi:hypothetical protein
MTRPKTAVDAPPRMVDAWRWVVAMAAWDYGDPSMLSDLIADEVPIPPEFAHAIAAVVKGDRSPMLKAGAKLKVQAVRLFEVATMVSASIAYLDYLRFEFSDPSLGPARGARAISEVDGVELSPIEVIRQLEADAEQVVKDAADGLGVPVATVRFALRELNARVARWPEI